MWQWNCQMWGKKIGYTECDKSTVKSDVDTAQCGNGTGKCEKKNRVPPNVIKVQLEVMLVFPNVTIEQSNVIKK